MHPWLTKTIAAAALAATALLFASGCETNAATGRSQFNSLSRDEEIAMGSQAMPGMIAEYGGKTNNPAIQQYITGIGRTLASKTEADNPSLPWEFTLLDAPEINAFATPGGKVYIARGLVEKMTNEAQLAGVLGHEIGHVTARHISEAISRQQGIQIGTAIGGAIIAGTASDDNRAAATAAGIGLAVGGQLVNLRFSRAQESESDTLGMRYMVRAGYDPKGMEQTMEILAAAAGGGGSSDFFATHPDPAKRRADVARLIRTTYASTQNNPQFQLFESRFQSQCLTPLKATPRAAAPKKASLESPSGTPRAFALNNPATWCAHCAAEADQSTSATTGDSEANRPLNSREDALPVR